MLCPACHDIFKKPDFLDGTQSDSIFYKHTTDTQSVREAALINGCQICAVLCFHFDEDPPEERPITELDLEYKIKFTDKYDGRINFFYRNCSRSFTVRSLGIRDEKDIAPHLCNDLDLFPVCTLSEENTTNWMQASKWMKECLEHHTQCDTMVGDGPWWPTRLLDVRELNGETSIRLIETRSIFPSEAYMTLSHRWGDATFIKLLKENLDELKAGILIDNLAQTFRDAVEVTRKFNIHYLWIDSLCIIQNSIDDWNKEALQMSQVYKHAICNIAATGAVDSTKGLFFDKNLHLVRPCKISIPARQTPTDVETVYIVDENFWQDRVEKAPLIRRAWVVQERLLARRVLHFNRDPLYWECQEKSACEVFPAAMPMCMMVDGNFKDIVPYTGAPGNSSKGSINSVISKEWIWRRLLSSYTGAQLTNPGDKEAALSGIVKVLEGVFADTCIAGLWRKGLPAQLAWSAAPPATSSPTYRAPSWSWLSIVGKTYAFASPAKKENDSDPLLISSYVVAELEDIFITRAGESALSPITSGFIRLRGMLYPVTWKDVYAFDGCMTSLKIEGSGGEGLYGYFDDRTFRATRSGWIMQIVVQRESGKFFGHGLLLRRNANGVFRRIGYVASYHPSARNLLSKRHRAMMEGEEDSKKKSAAEVIDETSASSLHIQPTSEDGEEQTIVII